MMEKQTLPRGWEKAKLADVSDLVFGQSPPSSTYNDYGEGWPFFQGKAEFGNVYPTTRKWCTKPTRIAQKYDILISVRAPVGPTNLASEECAIGRGLAAITPIIVRGFIHYYLKLIEHELDNKGTGTTFKAITKDILINQRIEIAPLNEQRRIVSKIEELFSDLDEGEAALKKAQRLLVTYRQSFLKAAITGELTRDWREANRDHLEFGEALLERILQTRREQWQGRGKYKEPHAPDTTNLPELPEGWVWTRMQQLAHVIGGLTKNSKRNTSPLKRPMLRVANVYQNRLELNDVHEIGIKESELERVSLQNGDMLIVEGNGSKDQIGRMAIWENQIPDCVHQNHLIGRVPGRCG